MDAACGGGVNVIRSEVLVSGGKVPRDRGQRDFVHR